MIGIVSSREGLNGINELKHAYKDKIESLRKQAAVPGATAPLEQPHSAPSTPTPSPSPHPPSSSPTAQSPQTPGVKSLSSYLDLAKSLALPPKEIEVLWRLRHANNPQSLHFALSATTFASLVRTARAHPQFVLPLPRPPTGNEIHFLQWTFPGEHATTVLFTHLAEYKLRGEYASPHTTVTFHSELAQAKGLVLGQGGVVPDRGVAVEEARWLLMCMQKFYGLQGGDGEKEERRRLLEMFSRGDEGFTVEKVVEEAEKVV